MSDDAMSALIAADLAGKGWSVREDYFAPELIADLRADLALREGLLEPAAIGRGAAAGLAPEVRSDRKLWLDGDGAAQTAYMARMTALCGALNRALFLGLFEFEAHYAIYPPGGFYKKHIDSFQGTRSRLVSTVTYLTPDWDEADGGHLVLYDGKDQAHELTRILPRAGTLAVFLSEEIPHEVLPPRRARASIAGWFRCNASGAGPIA